VLGIDLFTVQVDLEPAIGEGPEFQALDGGFIGA